MSYFKILFESVAESLSVISGQKFEIINLNDYIHVDDYDQMSREYEDHSRKQSNDLWKYLYQYTHTLRDLKIASLRGDVALFILALSLVVNIVFAVALINP